MSLAFVVDFLGFLFILIAAFTITSKYVISPKVRLFAFSSYMIACFFLGWLGLITVEISGGEAGQFLFAQQVVLVFINIRGLYRAIKEIKAGRIS